MIQKCIANWFAKRPLGFGVWLGKCLLNFLADRQMQLGTTKQPKHFSDRSLVEPPPPPPNPKGWTGSLTSISMTPRCARDAGLLQRMAHGLRAKNRRGMAGEMAGSPRKGRGPKWPGKWPDSQNLICPAIFQTVLSSSPFGGCPAISPAISRPFLALGPRATL